jgi:RNA polymerase sigma-70 factor (ECF subfamily)
MPATLSSVDDATLVTMATAGDNSAFEELLGRYGHRVFLMALRILGNRAEAEDVAQEVSVTAWRKLAELNDPAAVRTWLFRVAHRQCLGVLRARRDHELTGTLPDQAASHPASDPHRMAEAVATTQALSGALAKLPPPQRLTWLLAEIQGMPHIEIARLSGITEEAVRSRLARARVRLALAMHAWR